MDILFIDTFAQMSSVYMPLGINLLSTIINTKSNYTSEVVSFYNLCAQKKLPSNIFVEDNYKTIIDYILNKKTKIISFYTIDSSYFTSLIVAENIKKIDKDIKIIFAGPHASLCSYETLKAFDFIDMIAIGEGEKNIISIIDYFNNKEKIENIKGICYKKSDSIVYNEPQEINMDLDELPMLKLDMDIHPPIMPIDSGRGCPYNCTFCCTKTFWKRKVRLKSIDRLIDEIKYYITKYNIRQFVFVHDLFTANRENVLEFCNKVVDSNIHIAWSCSSRADTLDEEMISSMAKAGCEKIYLGIETGSERMQSEINKSLNISQAKNTMKLITKYNIPMKTSFIWGFPSEKEEDLIQTMDLIRYCVEEMSIKEITIDKCRGYPGTYIYLTEKENLISNEENFNLFAYPAKQHSEFIKSHPELFSSLFTFDNELIGKYFYLDMFINYVYNFFISKMPKTTNEIIAFYNNNLLDFYLAYEGEMKRITELLTRTLYHGEKLSDVRKKMFKSLEIFIENKIKDDFIIALYRFEAEVLKISISRNNNELVTQTYDYDMLLYYQNLKKKKERCKLVFTVTEDKEVSIYKEM